MHRCEHASPPGANVPERGTFTSVAVDVQFTTVALHQSLISQFIAFARLSEECRFVVGGKVRRAHNFRLWRASKILQVNFVFQLPLLGRTAAHSVRGGASTVKF